MKLLIHCVHYPVCSGRYFVDALKRLGHEVYHVGDPTGRNIWGMMVPEEYAWHQELPPDGWQPDYAILMDTAYQWHHPTAPTVIYTVDNHVRNVRQGGIEHYFLAHKSVSITEWGDDCSWVPCGYDPVAFPPSQIEWSKREFDVCCLGFMYPKRWSLVNAMKDAGLKVVAGCGMVYDQYRDLYHNSRVALVSSACGDLPIRFFEGIGMGCIVISDPIADFAYLDQIRSKKHENGIQHYVYKSVEQAVELASALQKVDERDRYINPEALADHTWDERCKVILNWLEARS